MNDQAGTPAAILGEGASPHDPVNTGSTAGKSVIVTTNAAALLILTLASLVVSVFIVTSNAADSAAPLTSFPLDDSWIHHTYARNFGQGGTLSYVPGRWEAGFTSVLSAVVLAPLHTLHLGDIAVVYATKFLGFLLAVAASWLTYLTVRRMTGWTLAAGLAGLAVAVHPLFVADAVSGMEVSLVAACLMFTIWAWTEERWKLLALSLPLTALSRPEGILFAALVVTAVTSTELIRAVRSNRGLNFSVLAASRSLSPFELRVVSTIRTVGRAVLPDDEVAGRDASPGRNNWDAWAAGAVIAYWPAIKKVLLIAAPFTVIVVVYLGYMQAINGTWYPNTFLVKADRRPGLVKFDNLESYWRGYIWPLWPIVLSGILAAIVNAVIRVRQGQLALAAMPAVTLVFFFSPINSQPFLRFGPAVEFDLPYWGIVDRRYVDIAIPLLAVEIGVAAFLLRRHVTRHAGWIPVAILGVSLAWSALNLAPAAREYAWASDGIQHVDEYLAKYIRDELPAGSTVMVGEAGAAGYWGNRDHVVLDLVGLNDKENIGHPVTFLIDIRDPDFIIVGLQEFESGLIDGTEVARRSQRYPSYLGQPTLVLLKDPRPGGQ